MNKWFLFIIIAGIFHSVHFFFLKTSKNSGQVRHIQSIDKTSCKKENKKKFFLQIFKDYNNIFWMDQLYPMSLSKSYYAYSMYAEFKKHFDSCEMYNTPKYLFEFSEFLFNKGHVAYKDIMSALIYPIYSESKAKEIYNRGLLNDHYYYIQKINNKLWPHIKHVIFNKESHDSEKNKGIMARLNREVNPTYYNIAEWYLDMKAADMNPDNEEQTSRTKIAIRYIFYTVDARIRKGYRLLMPSFLEKILKDDKLVIKVDTVVKAIDQLELEGWNANLFSQKFLDKLEGKVNLEELIEILGLFYSQAVDFPQDYFLSWIRDLPHGHNKKVFSLIKKINIQYFKLENLAANLYFSQVGNNIFSLSISTNEKKSSYKSRHLLAGTWIGCLLKQQGYDEITALQTVEIIITRYRNVRDFINLQVYRINDLFSLDTLDSEGEEKSKINDINDNIQYAKFGFSVCKHKESN